MRSLAPARADYFGWILLAGAWWAALEVVVGSAMHVAGSPFVGVAMTTAGVGSALGIAHLSRAGGVVIGAAILAAGAKVAAVGPTGLSPAIAILAEGLLAGFFLKRGGPAAALAAALAWDAVHPALVGSWLSGRSAAEVAVRMSALGTAVGAPVGPLAWFVGLGLRMVPAALVLAVQRRRD